MSSVVPIEWPSPLGYCEGADKGFCSQQVFFVSSRHIPMQHLCLAAQNGTVQRRPIQFRPAVSARLRSLKGVGVDVGFWKCQPPAFKDKLQIDTEL